MQSKSMAEAVQVEAAVTKTRLVKVTNEDVVDGLLTDVCAGLLTGEQPIIFTSTAVRGADVGSRFSSIVM